ncbi:hypothetical protein TSUD_289510 [Trifolium subterraneum]|uniref:RNase H type-1 domain-containing protein n=1 Tax=Trifolium subterraneum TaxID=3900 RepID=A0A2Z6MLZ1_TRISU|nr:hypothetical protein TSUD_289510 [Trifolium subterraneum]
MLRLDWEVKLKHIYREENCCADGLANLAINLPKGIVLFDVCPNAVRERFDADLGWDSDLMSSTLKVGKTLHQRPLVPQFRDGVRLGLGTIDTTLS